MVWIQVIFQICWSTMRLSVAWDPRVGVSWLFPNQALSPEVTRLLLYGPLSCGAPCLRISDKLNWYHLYVSCQNLVLCKSFLTVVELLLLVLFYHIALFLFLYFMMVLLVLIVLSYNVLCVIFLNYVLICSVNHFVILFRKVLYKSSLLLLLFVM